MIIPVTLIIGGLVGAVYDGKFGFIVLAIGGLLAVIGVSVGH